MVIILDVPILRIFAVEVTLYVSMMNEKTFSQHCDYIACDSHSSSSNFVSVQFKKTGPGCSKLMMSLVNVSLKFQTLISEICQYFLLEKCFSHFFNKKYQCIWL